MRCAFDCEDEEEDDDEGQEKEPKVLIILRSYALWITRRTAPEAATAMAQTTSSHSGLEPVAEAGIDQVSVVVAVSAERFIVVGVEAVTQ